ncbi:MAG: prepilin-type N-terminal cleavage/methylation domain-containing protein [Proteocatella sp.]
MNKKTMKNNSGFTLIELLIVLTILVALTLLGTYKYFNIVEENKQKIDITNAKMLAEAVDVADATGKLVLTEGSTTVEYSQLETILDKEITPTSKKYTGGNTDAKFIITVVKSGDVFTTTITAENQTIYPTTTETVPEN